MAPAAPGLFALPTLILAMYRAISPYYYTDSPGGNMYLYNDATWLAEKLKEFVNTWNARDDLTPRAYGMVRLDTEIKVLESFGKRAYTNELIAQRTIITDLLNGKSTSWLAILPILTIEKAHKTSSNNHPPPSPQPSSPSSNTHAPNPTSSQPSSPTAPPVPPPAH